jgi:hypothetical protein
MKFVILLRKEWLNLLFLFLTLIVLCMTLGNAT